MKKQTIRKQRELKKISEEKRQKEISDILCKFPARVFFSSTGENTYRVKEIIQKYKIPVPSVQSEYFSLLEFFCWFYDFLASERFLPKDDESLLSINPQKAFQKERAKRERIKRMRDEGLLVPIDLVQEIMYRFTTVIRITGERLGERFGDEVLEEISDAIIEARDHIKDILTLNEQDQNKNDPTGEENDN